MAKTKVYYNGACPVCAAGISRQRRQLAGRETQFEWIDVDTDNAAVRGIDAGLEFVRERLHVVDDAGEIHVGAAAFTALWKLTPGQRTIGWFSQLPILRTVLRWVYNAFAAGLYRWNRRHNRW